MTDPQANRSVVRVGLRWRVMLLLIAVLATTALVFGYARYRERGEQIYAELEASAADAHRTFTTLLQASLDQQSVLAAQIATQVDPDADLDALPLLVTSDVLAQYSIMDFYDNRGAPLARLGIDDAGDPGRDALVMAMAETPWGLRRPDIHISCNQTCTVFSVVPALGRGGRPLIVGVGLDLNVLLVSAHSISGVDVGVIAGKGAPAELIEITNAPTLFPVVSRLPEHAAPDALTVDHDGRAWLIHQFPLPLQLGDAARFLAVLNLDPYTTRIRQSLKDEFLRTLAGLVISVLLLGLALTPPLRRISQVSNTLPALARQEFDAVREALAPVAGGWVQDETRALASEVHALSYRLEELLEVEQESERKSFFISTLSHEVRTPLNGVLGLLELHEKSPLSPQQQDDVRAIREASAGLLNVINEVLEFSKLDAGATELAREPVFLPAVCEAALNVVSGQVDGAAVRLILDFRSGVPDYILGDEARLRHVLTNLCSNAAKFTAMGHVLLTVEPADSAGCLLFSVTDTGPGIDPQEQARLFRPYVQLASEQAAGGTGLGLAICKKVVDQMGGEIGVESELGGGSRFWFELPLSHAAGAPAQTWPALHGLGVALELMHPLEKASITRMLQLAGAELAPRQRASVLIGDQLPPKPPGVFVQLSGQAGSARLVRRPVSPRTLCLAVSELVAPLGVSSAAADEAEPQQQVRHNVLVADDHEVNRHVLKRQLELFGKTVTLTRDGAEALAEFVRQRFDLVITDIQMPNMDGREFARRAREVDARCERRTPIIALTANATVPDAEEGGLFDDTLAKPIDLAQLEAAINRQIGADTVARAEPGSTADTEPESPAKTLDFERLLSNVGDRVFALEVIDEFLRISEELMQEVAEATAPSDAWKQQVHKWRGSASTIGADRLQAALTRLEACGDEDGEAFQQALAVTRREYAAFVSHCELLRD